MTYRTINHFLAAVRDILLIIVLMLALVLGYRVAVALGDLGDRMQQLTTATVVTE